MAEARVERRLAALHAADVASYSRGSFSAIGHSGLNFAGLLGRKSGLASAPLLAQRAHCAASCRAANVAL